MQRRASDPSAMRNKLSDWLLSRGPCAEVFNVPFAEGVSVWFHFKPCIRLTFDLWITLVSSDSKQKTDFAAKGNEWFDFFFFSREKHNKRKGKSHLLVLYPHPHFVLPCLPISLSVSYKWGEIS